MSKSTANNLGGGVRYGSAEPPGVKPRRKKIEATFSEEAMDISFTPASEKIPVQMNRFTFFEVPWLLSMLKPCIHWQRDTVQAVLSACLMVEAMSSMMMTSSREKVLLSLLAELKIRGRLPKNLDQKIDAFIENNSAEPKRS